jgi:hypothetical protein
MNLQVFHLLKRKIEFSHFLLTPVLQLTDTLIYTYKQFVNKIQQVSKQIFHY